MCHVSCRIICSFLISCNLNILFILLIEDPNNQQSVGILLSISHYNAIDCMSYIAYRHIPYKHNFKLLFHVSGHVIWIKPNTLRYTFFFRPSHILNHLFSKFHRASRAKPLVDTLAEKQNTAQIIR